MAFTSTYYLITSVYPPLKHRTAMSGVSLPGETQTMALMARFTFEGEPIG